MGYLGQLVNSTDRGYTDAIVYRNMAGRIIVKSRNAFSVAANAVTTAFLHRHAIWRAQTFRRLFIFQPEPLAPKINLFSNDCFPPEVGSLMSATVKNT